MSVRRILWDTSRHSMTLRSYCKIEVMNPGHSSNLERRSVGERNEREEERERGREGERREG